MEIKLKILNLAQLLGFRATFHTLLLLYLHARAKFTGVHTENYTEIHPYSKYILLVLCGGVRFLLIKITFRLLKHLRGDSPGTVKSQPSFIRSSLTPGLCCQ